MAVAATTLEWTNSNQAYAHGVKFLVYGGPGAGKTRLIPTLPRPIIASAESGMISIAQHSIRAAKIKTLAHFTEFYRFCAGSAEMRDFDSISIDSVSEIAEVFLQDAKARASDPRQAYGELVERMIQILKLFRDIPGKHLYVSCKMDWQDDEQKRWHYGPMVPGSKLGPALPYLFDEVFFATKKEFLDPATNSTRDFEVLQTFSDAQHIAPKDRSGKLEAYEPQNLSYIIKKITGV